MNSNRLKEILNKRKITITALEMRSGVSRSHINNIINHKNVSVEILEKITASLGLEMKIWWENDETYASMVEDVKEVYKKNETALVKTLRDEIKQLKIANKDLRQFKSEMIDKNLQLNEQLGRKKDSFST